MNKFVENISSKFICLTLFLFCACSSNEADFGKYIKALSPYEITVLDLFFRTCLAEAGGYSLYGKKPVTVLGYKEKKIPLLLHETIAKQSAIFREGIRIWEKSGLSKIKSDFLICRSKNVSYYGWNDFFLINKISFLKTVLQNISLFQYVLGPKITPQSLLDKFENPQEHLASLFNEDRVLNGIILGYGTQNALYGSREEYLSEHCTIGKEQIPKMIRHNQFYLATNRDCAIKNSYPSFGFSTLEQELKELNKDSFVTVDRYPLSPKLPWFGAFPNAETDILLKNYKLVQKKLSRVLNSPKFLEEVLSQFWGSRIALPQPKSSLYALLVDKLKNEKNLSEYFGQALWDTLKKDVEPEVVETFIQGMMASRQEAGPVYSEEVFGEIYHKQREWDKLREAKNHLQMTEVFFQSIQESHPVIAGKIHYQILMEGNGESLDSSATEVLLSYTISTFSGLGLCAKEQEAFQLKDLVQGLVVGMNGMKLEEVREIYIHPEWAYGESSNLDPNLGLIAKIKLLDIKSKGESAQSFQPLELRSDNFSAAEIESSYVEWTQKLYHQLGQKIWDRMKMLKFISLDQVIEGLRNARQGKTIDLEKNWEILNQLDLLSRIDK
jgi:FKBP-type peptidyl-prolyl cis-trans isomerase